MVVAHMKEEFLNQKIALALMNNRAKAIRQLNMMYLNYKWHNKLVEANALQQIKMNVQLLGKMHKGKLWR